MTIRLTLALFLAIVLASCLPSVAPNLGDGTGRGYLGYLDGAAVFSIFAGASEATLVITGENLVVDDPRCVAVPHVVEAYSCRIGQVLPARLERVVFDGQEVILWLAWCDGPRCYRLVADFRPVRL